MGHIPEEFNVQWEYKSKCLIESGGIINALNSIKITLYSEALDRPRVNTDVLSIENLYAMNHGEKCRETFLNWLDVEFNLNWSQGNFIQNYLFRLIHLIYLSIFVKEITPLMCSERQMSTIDDKKCIQMRDFDCVYCGLIFQSTADLAEHQLKECCIKIDIFKVHLI